MAAARVRSASGSARRTSSRVPTAQATQMASQITVSAHIGKEARTGTQVTLLR